VTDISGNIKRQYTSPKIRTAGWWAVFLLLLASCGHRPKPAPVHHKANIDYARLFSNLQGTWISYEYMLNLSKTMSPSSSAAFMEGIFSFTIDSGRLVNDTLHCLSWINSHAERDLWIAFDSPDTFGLYSIGINQAPGENNDQRGLGTDNITRIKIDSPFLTIYTSTFDSVRYIFYDHLPKYTPADYALKHYTTAALFKGAYYIKDSNMVFGSSRIWFDPKNIGRINGSPAYDSFDINVDVLSQNDSLDYMELFDSRKQTESRSFIYSIHKNTMQIYPALDTTVSCVLYRIQASDSLTGR